MDTPDAAPWSLASDPAEETDLPTDIIPKLRRAGSLTRESYSTIKSEHPDQFHTHVFPFYQKTFDRRKKDKEGTVATETESVSFAGVKFDIRKGSAHLLTPSGGGPGAPYSDLLEKLKSATSLTDPEIGNQLVKIMREGEIPENIPRGAWQVLVELFAIVAISEMARSSSAPAFFLFRSR